MKLVSVGGRFWTDNKDGTGTVFRHYALGTVTAEANFILSINPVASSALLSFATSTGLQNLAPTQGLTVSASAHGVIADGVTDDTIAVATALKASRGGTLILPAGTIMVAALIVPSDIRVIGQGPGRTTIKLIAGANGHLLRNEDQLSGDHRIWLEGFSLDGNGAHQKSSSHVVHMDQVVDSYFDVECRNARGAGFLLTNGARNRFGPKMYCHSNGKYGAGYGLYIHNSSDNQILGGKYDDNCIGIAVESSGRGTSRRNSITSASCTGNRADFGQSGAGVHFEQSNGNDCNDGLLIDTVCKDGRGVGVNNTGCDLKISGGIISNNRDSGIATMAARDFLYFGVVLNNNATGQSNGYRAEARFDDTDLEPGSYGKVVDCSLRGTAPDGGFKTLSRYSGVTFSGNSLSGYKIPYNLAGLSDRVTA